MRLMQQAGREGLCPGNAESAGKRFSGKTRKRRPVSAPHPGAECLGRGTDQRLFLRGPLLPRGAKARHEEGGGCRGPRLLTIVHLLLRDGGVHRERGGAYFDRLNPSRTAKKLTKRLERIGFEVVIRRSPLSPVPPKDVVLAEVCSKCHKWRLGKCIHDDPRPKRTNRRRKPEESTT